MSRGLGIIQQAILALLKGRDGALPMESARWLLYEADQSPITEGKLPNDWNTAILRAAKSLEERGLIAITSRRLESFRECVEFYPDKTLIAGRRELRKRFLPLLLEWIEAPDGIVPRYDEAQNENFHLQGLSEPDVQTLQRRWQEIEGTLKSLFGQGSQPSDHLLRLICKGRYLFREADIEVHASFAATIRAVLEHQLVPESLASDLQKFQEEFLPRKGAGSLRLKSLIRTFADVPRHRQCKLKIATLKYLHGRERAFVEAMPGFRQKQGFEGNWLNMEPSFLQFEHAYSPDLVRIFDQTVFQRFHFLQYRD